MSWTVDTSANVVVDEGGVRYEGGDGGAEKKGNAIWIDEVVDEVQCWNFKITGGSGVWLGVGTEDNFGPGYQLRGLMFGGPGNLSDGGALVTGHWGPRLGAGDDVVMRLEVRGDNITLAFSRNGEGLGVAYHIQGWGGGQLRPVVSLDSPGQGVVMSAGPVCGLECMAPAPGPAPGIAGRWQHQGGECLLSVEEEGPGVWRVGIKVSNSMSCTVTETGGVFSAGPVRSTRMMPSPEMQGMEARFRELLGGITRIAREGVGLVVTAGEVSEHFTVAADPTPATKDRVRWMNCERK